MKNQWTTPYSKREMHKYATVNTGESIVQQDDANESDINVIVGRFMKTGQLPTVQAAAISGDFTNAGDFRENLERIQAAQNAFSELPAQVRKQFDNDPASFIEFATKKENLEELRTMGLAPPAPTKAPPMEVRVIPDPQP